MGLAHDLGKKIGETLAPVRAGDDGLASRMLAVLDRRTLSVTSPQFTDGGSLPRELTSDSESAVAPIIAWSNVPAGTQSLVVIAEDPDAPFPRPFVHWLVYGIPTSVSGLAGPQALEGKNSQLSEGFTPAAPPAGHGMHHYHFQVFALDVAVDLARGAGRSSLLEEMRGHVLGWGEIVGTYERS